MIGDDVIVTVVEVDRGRVRLGITAPKEVPIYRSELLPLNDPRRQIEPELGGEA